MGEAGAAIVFPSVDDLVHINRRLIQSTGGYYVDPDNLRSAGSIHWLVDMLQHPLFGEDPLPSFPQKAAYLAWAIIEGHPFWDGNKRTAIFALHFFAHLNGARLDCDDDANVQVALRVATHSWRLADLEAWLVEHLSTTAQ